MNAVAPSAPEILDPATSESGVERAWGRTVVVRLPAALAERLYLIRDRLADAADCERVTVSTAIRYALDTAPLPE